MYVYTHIQVHIHASNHACIGFSFSLFVKKKCLGKNLRRAVEAENENYKTNS